jgi:hypothetical protein
MDLNNWIYSVIGINSKIKLIRSFFFEDVSKSQVQAMTLVPKSSKDVEDIFICIGMKQIFEKTDIKFYVEVHAKKGKFFSALAY